MSKRLQNRASPQDASAAAPPVMPQRGTDRVAALTSYGAVLNELKRFDEALASYDQAIALRPDHVTALINRGNILLRLRRLDEALTSYDRAIVLKPDYAEAFANRGAVLSELKRFGEALQSYDRAIMLQPDNSGTLFSRGNTLLRLGRPGEAIESYDKAIALNPGYAEAFGNRGIALGMVRRFDEAIVSQQRAITLQPGYAEGHYNLGMALRGQGRRAEAIAQFERALALHPHDIETKIALCMAHLPVLYKDECEIENCRTAYRHSLESLCRDVDQHARLGDLADAIGSSQPFYLAYQGYNDRELQSHYGSLVCRIMAQRYPTATLAPAPRVDEPVRLGIVSGFFRRHSNWKIPVKGWLSRIDRRRFRIFGYHTGVATDEETQAAAALCDRFVQGPLSIEHWRAAILQDAPHVLIYPEVGMDPTAAQLAAQRLAATQCNSWGHPDTSGYPTLDYYLSSALMEPSEAQEHYSERLIRLPNLSIHYEPPNLQPMPLRRTELGIRATAITLWCGQSPFKYLPQYDHVFPRIACGVPDCQFVFIQYAGGPYVIELFWRRLETAFSAHNIRAADYCLVLPRLDAQKFLAVQGQCDIVLDSIGWSGCNSTLESLQHDLPIVTLIGSLMRGRHSAAILTMMGVGDTIVSTIDDYVAAAVRLACDEPWRMAIKHRIAANKHRLYRDEACIVALQDFLESVARR